MMTKMKRKLFHIVALEADEYDADISFDEVEGDDYMEHAIFDEESDRFVFHNDNIHDDPYKFLEGFIAGVDVMGGTVEVEEVVLFMNEDESPQNTSDIRCALIRHIMKED